VIPLPPGCKVSYEIRFFVSELTNEMGEWFNMIGGHAGAIEEFDYLGRKHIVKQVQYGKAKSSYVTKDGTGLTLIRFTGEDASTASVFLLKFMEQIQKHNFNIYKDGKENVY
jgi:hypothetical protein